VGVGVVVVVTGVAVSRVLWGRFAFGDVVVMDGFGPLGPFMYFTRGQSVSNFALALVVEQFADQRSSDGETLEAERERGDGVPCVDFLQRFAQEQLVPNLSLALMDRMSDQTFDRGETGSRDRGRREGVPCVESLLNLTRNNAVFSPLPEPVGVAADKRDTGLVGVPGVELLLKITGEKLDLISLELLEQATDERERVEGVPSLELSSINSDLTFGVVVVVEEGNERCSRGDGREPGLDGRNGDGEGSGIDLLEVWLRNGLTGDWSVQGIDGERTGDEGGEDSFREHGDNECREEEEITTAPGLKIGK